MESELSQLASQVDQIIKQNLKKKEDVDKKADKMVEEFIRMKITTALKEWSTEQTEYILVIIFESDTELILTEQKNAINRMIEKVNFTTSENMEAEILKRGDQISQIIEQLKTEINPLQINYMFNKKMVCHLQQKIHKITIEHKK